MRYFGKIDYYGIVNNEKLKSSIIHRNIITTSNSIYSTTLNSPCTLILGIRKITGSHPKTIIRNIKR